MRTVVSVVMVMMCTVMVQADVKPQRDFNLQRVRWAHTHFMMFALKHE